MKIAASFSMGRLAPKHDLNIHGSRATSQNVTPNPIKEDAIFVDDLSTNILGEKLCHTISLHNSILKFEFQRCGFLELQINRFMKHINSAGAASYTFLSPTFPPILFDGSKQTLSPLLLLWVGIHSL